MSDLIIEMVELVEYEFNNIEIDILSQYVMDVIEDYKNFWSLSAADKYDLLVDEIIEKLN